MANKKRNKYTRNIRKLEPSGFKPLLQLFSNTSPDFGGKTLLQNYSNSTPVFEAFSLEILTQHLSNAYPDFSLIFLKSLFMLCC